jgi:hypothetical protein
MALRVLYNQRCIGGKHMQYDLLRKRWKNERREEQRAVDYELRTTPYVIWKASLSEEHVSLNPRELDSIVRIISSQDAFSQQ